MSNNLFDDCGIPNYIFINAPNIDISKPNWRETAASSYFKLKLYPYKTTYGTLEFGKYDKIEIIDVLTLIEKALIEKAFTENPQNASYTSKIPKNITKNIKLSDVILNRDCLEYAFLILNKLEILYIYFNFESESLKYLASFLIIAYIFFSHKNFLHIITILLTKFDSFKGNQTYGGSKYKLYIQNVEYTFIRQLSFITEDLEEAYIEHISGYVESRNENEDTFLRFININNPINLRDMMMRDELTSLFYSIASEQCDSFLELTFLLLGAGAAIFNTSSFNENVLLLIPQFVKKLISLNKPVIKYEKLRYIYGIHYFDHNFHILKHVFNRSYIAIAQKQYDFTQKWLLVISNINIVHIHSFHPLEDKYLVAQLTTSKMLRYLFAENMPDDANLPLFLKQIQDSRVEPTPLQIVEIAINEGTTKEPIEAMLMELTQNSVDAIREFNPSNKNIEIKVFDIKGQSQQVLLTITDYVGMTVEAFISIGIPFLSTKTPSETVTGEMGSGFFNVYRISDEVIIDTIKNNLHIVSRDIPIRQNNRVIDIKRSIYATKMDQKNRTTISIVIPTPTRYEYVQTLNNIEFISRQILGLVDQKITYNNIAINIPRTLSGEVGHFKIYTTKSTDAIHESYILTKGIPFAPLSTYFKDYLRVYDTIMLVSKNLIVDVSHGGYVPVQTRTKIKLSPESEQEYRKMILDTIFIGILNAINNKTLYVSDLINNYYSYGPTSQLKFTTYSTDILDIRTSIEEYFKQIHFQGQKSIVEIMNECIYVVNDQEYAKVRSKLSNVVSSLFDTPFEWINTQIQNIIMGWFESKNKLTTSKKVSTPVKESKPEEESTPSRMKTTDMESISNILCTEWILTFIEIAKKADIRNYKSHKIPMIVTKEDKKDKYTLGSYYKSENTIKINILLWKSRDLVEIYDVFLHEKNILEYPEKLKHNFIYRKFFEYSFPCTTLPHELEHYRMSTEHNESHDSQLVLLYEGDSRIYRTFDQVANAVYKCVLQNEFLSILVNKLRNRQSEIESLIKKII